MQEERKIVLKMEQGDAAVVKAVNAAASVGYGNKLSMSELISESLHSEYSGIKMVQNRDLVGMICRVTEASNKLSFMKNCSFVRDGDTPRVSWRDTQVSASTKDLAEKGFGYFDGKWVLTDKDGHIKEIDLEGEKGKSKLLFSTALYYLLRTRFKTDADLVKLDVKERTKLIEAGDIVAFELCRVRLFSEYQYTRGEAKVQSVTINFVTNSVGGAEIQDFTVKEEENILTLEQAVEINQGLVQDSPQPTPSDSIAEVKEETIDEREI